MGCKPPVDEQGQGQGHHWLVLLPAVGGQHLHNGGHHHNLCSTMSKFNLCLRNLIWFVGKHLGGSLDAEKTKLTDVHRPSGPYIHCLLIHTLFTARQRKRKPQWSVLLDAYTRVSPPELICYMYFVHCPPSLQHTRRHTHTREPTHSRQVKL